MFRKKWEWLIWFYNKILPFSMVDQMENALAVMGIIKDKRKSIRHFVQMRILSKNDLVT